MAFRIGVKQIPGLCHRGLVPDCGHHVLKGAPLGGVIMHIIGRQQRQVVSARKTVQTIKPRNIIPAIEVGRGEVTQGRALAGEVREEVGERRGEPVPTASVTLNLFQGPFLLMRCRLRRRDGC